MAASEPTLEPSGGEIGLATGDAAALGRQTADAWTDFLAVVESVDLDRPTRRKGIKARQTVAKVGDWPESHQLSQILLDAEAGNLQDIDQDAIDDAVIAAHENDSPTEILNGIRRARDSVAAWVAGEADSNSSHDFNTLATRQVGSPLGPLPVVTYAHAAAFQLAIAARDILPASERVPTRLAVAGLRALVDTTGAIAARMNIPAGLAVITDSGSAFTRSTSQGWSAGTIDSDSARQLPGIEGEMEVVLDVAAGRQSPFNRFGKPKITIRDLSHLLVLAPITRDVPGLPGGVVLSRAASVLSAVNPRGRKGR